MIVRFAEQLVRDALSDTPVVLIHGPRQSGKSTLAQHLCRETGARYVTLDDPAALDLARSRPNEFVATYKPPVAIDEIQRAPGIFLAIKAQVDLDRRPGSFLLTGSANVLQLPKVSDSLAGRMEVIDLPPFTQMELDGGHGNVVNALFEPNFDNHRFQAADRDDVIERIVRGGFPEPVARSPRRRRPWFESYTRTLLERDVRDLANIEGLTQMPRLLTLLATRAGDTLNVTGLSRETAIAPTTLTRYLDLLQALFLLQTVPAWSSTPDVRLIKAPKAFLVDTGLLCHLARWDETSLREDGAALTRAVRNLVANELARHATTSERRPWLLHLRTVRQKEVDFILERPDGGIVGVMVSAHATVDLSDAEGLRWLQEVAGERFVRGVVLSLSAEVRPLAPRIMTAPMSALWS